MPASACLRIVLDLSDEKLAKLEALGPLVAKVTSAFLESRWVWPKRHETLTPYCFMLTDPRAAEIDVAGLERLADELQLKLFGTSGLGAVTLVILDGDADDTARFVQMDHASLKQATAEPLQPTPFGGRLLKIGAAAEDSQAMQWRTLKRAPTTLKAARIDRLNSAVLETSFRGVYFSPRQSFVGSGVSASATGEAGQFSLVDGADRLPREREVEFDLACIKAGRLHLLELPFTGVMFLPVCFSSLMRRSTREAYALEFRTLPPDKRQQLAAVVYDVPRAPPFHAFGDIHQLLDKHFAIIDLQVADAGFEIDSVPRGTVASVTFRLPDGDERLRLAALRRFMERRELFRRRGVWPAVTNVRTPAELAACLREKTPFLSGPAVCGAVDEAIGSLPWEPARLPLTSAA
jgi:hypothetical protein